jgi:pimeloyl-ACP methyl ester carboxylesterase
MPGKLSACCVDGYALSYRRRGAGEPAVLVHGLGTHSFLWANVVPALTRVFDVVCVDLLGCGGSDKPDGADYGLAAHAERLRKLVQALGLGRVHLVGHDTGAGISLLFAVGWPGLVRTLTLVNSIGYEERAVPVPLAITTPLPGFLSVPMRKAAPLFLHRVLRVRDRPRRAQVHELAAPLSTEQGLRALRTSARDLSRGELARIAPRLRDLRVPTTLVWGMADSHRPFTTAERLYQDIPAARLVRIPGAGHLVPIDAPDELARVLRETMARA